jgi:hypothetical protein
MEAPTLMRSFRLTLFLVALICPLAFICFSSDANAINQASLCQPTERVIFSCSLKRPAKLVALCASKSLTKETGYLQYRFGFPGKVELEYPKQTDGSSQLFRYHHYFRAQVDLTEISFSNEGVEYTVFDNYNGEEKPAVSEEGVTVSAKGKDTTLVCKGRAKVDFENLQNVLPPVE